METELRTVDINGTEQLQSNDSAPVHLSPPFYKRLFY